MLSQTAAGSYEKLQEESILISPTYEVKRRIHVGHRFATSLAARDKLHVEEARPDADVCIPIHREHRNELSGRGILEAKRGLFCKCCRGESRTPVFFNVLDDQVSSAKVAEIR